MKIFNYHPVTKEFISESVADKDPRNDTRVLIPSYATDSPAPSARENEVAQFIDGEWSVKPDFRGTEYWLNGEKHTIENIGETVTDAASLTKPELTDDEKYEADARTVRSRRNAIIAETDYFMLSDAPTPPQGLMEYRQALRDITDQAGFPENVEWPELEGETNEQGS